MSKLISVADDIYEMLRAMKAQQSYSEVLRPILKKVSNQHKILACAGKGGINKDALKNLKEGWKKWNEQYV